MPGSPLNINQKIICQTVGGDIMSGMSFFFQEAKKNTHGRHWAVLFVLTTLLIYIYVFLRRKAFFFFF
jgi:hypothetical protein